MSARYGGAETSVKTTVKRSNYAIARHLQHCILYHTCRRTWTLFREQRRHIRFTRWNAELIQERFLSLCFFFLSSTTTISDKPIGIALAWLIGWEARKNSCRVRARKMYTREEEEEEEEEEGTQAIARKQEGREVREEPSGRDLVGMQRPARINRSRDPGEFIRFAAASLKAARVSFASRSSQRPGTHAGARIADPAHSHTQRTSQKAPWEREETI